MSGDATDADRVRLMRRTLTVTGAGIYLATHVAGPLSAETMAAAHESDELELRIGRVGPDRADDLELREREARAAVAAAVYAELPRVVLAHGAPDAARTLAVEILAARAGAPSRVLLIDGVDEPVAHAVRQAARAARATVDVIPEAPRILAGDVALVVMARLDPFGRLADPRSFAAAARRAGARLLVDASRSVGALPERVSELGADAIVADVHRWLLGPQGMALAWLSPELGDEMPDRLRDAAAPFGRAQLLSLARSVGWLLMYVGLPWATARTERLAKQLRAGLAAVDGVEILGPVDASELHATGRGVEVPGRDSDATEPPVGAAGPASPLLAFRIRGWEAEDAADELSRSIFAITDVDRGADALRVSVGAWNLEDELGRFVERIADLAAHTPETLPRKPALTIIGGAQPGPRE
jgi:selenocysteine lyase/cysteine desulfurase